MIHSSLQTDWFAGDEPRSIVWDDETGEVSGEHSAVPLVREYMADAVRDGGLQVDDGFWRLRDPRRDPASFVVLLMFSLAAAFDAATLPEALRSADIEGMLEPARIEPGSVF